MKRTAIGTAVAIGIAIGIAAAQAIDIHVAFASDDAGRFRRLTG